MTDKEAERTKRLRTAVRSDLIPWMSSFGFVRGKRSLAVQPDERSFGPVFQRRRDGYYDEIHTLWWTWNRPRFMLEFWTDQPDRMTDPGQDPDLYKGAYHARIWAGRRRWSDRLWGIRETWYGPGTTVEEAIDLARQRVADLDSYLRNGHPTKYLSLIGIPVMTTADPEVARHIV